MLGFMIKTEQQKGGWRRSENFGAVVGSLSQDPEVGSGPVGVDLGRSRMQYNPQGRPVGPSVLDTC